MSPSSLMNASATIAAVADTCIDCGKCVDECAFLTASGTPGSIARCVDTAHKTLSAYQCSLCGLCAEVCPVDLNPRTMFLTLRQEAVRRGVGPLREHKRILSYERTGTSPLFSWYGLPEGCDTVFFPGCTLSGTRPALTNTLYEHLASHIPGLGIVLDCCSKPSHDLGCAQDFDDAFGDLRQWLVDNGVTTVLTACPSCHAMFSRYGEGLTPVTVYEILAANPLPPEEAVSGTVTVHDPCVLRDHPSSQQAVRTLLERRGLDVEEMPHHGAKTLCCGEGGAVPLVAADMGKTWTTRRAKEADGRTIVTFCAGCVNTLMRSAPTVHILDLVFWPQRTMLGYARISRAPVTYLNRLGLKRRLRKTLTTHTSRRRQKTF
ncbi:hypothetical protein JCM16814_27390 [Desulfobaculum senezii]